MLAFGYRVVERFCDGVEARQSLVESCDGAKIVIPVRCELLDDLFCIVSYSHFRGCHRPACANVTKDCVTLTRCLARSQPCRDLPRLLAATLFLSLATAGCAEEGSSADVGPNPWTDAGNADADATGDVATDSFTAHYFTGWSTPYIHYETEDAWTEVPGEPMTAEGEVCGTSSIPNAGMDPSSWSSTMGLTAGTTTRIRTTRRPLQEFWIKDGQDPRVQARRRAGSAVLRPTWICGHGTCNEAEQRCDCESDYLYDASARTCVEDPCAGVDCGDGICDPATGKCVDVCDPDRTSGDFEFCVQTTASSYALVIKYTGVGTDRLGGERDAAQRRGCGLELVVRFCDADVPDCDERGGAEQVCLSASVGGWKWPTRPSALRALSGSEAGSAMRISFGRTRFCTR